MYAQIDQLIGSPALSMAIGQVNQNPALTPTGIFSSAVDPWWGAGEFLYAYANGTIRAFGLCVLTPTFQAVGGVNFIGSQYRMDATEVTNVANQGRPLAVAMQPMIAGQLGWFCIAGIIPVNSTAAVAVGAAVGITAAGQAGANAAGKQILNVDCLGSSATSLGKPNCTAPIGTTVLQVPNSDGWFPGVFLSGTGIAAGTTVVSVDGSGRFVTLSAAVTATIAGTVTATYNNAVIFFNVMRLMRSSLQGAIT